MSNRQRFSKILQIRKGDKKGTGRGGDFGKNLDQMFRVVFNTSRDDWQKLARRFENHYHKNDMHISAGDEDGQYYVYKVDFRLPPLENPMDNFEFAYTLHGSIPYARSDGTGEYWEFLREPGSLRFLVMGGEVVTEHEDVSGNVWTPGERRPVDPNSPLFVYHKDGKKKTHDPKSLMTLQTLLPYLGVVKNSSVISHSINDAHLIKERLEALIAVIEDSGVPAVKVPLVLVRRQEEITKSWGEGAKRELEWLWDIDFAPEFQEKYLSDILGEEAFDEGPEQKKSGGIFDPDESNAKPRQTSKAPVEPEEENDKTKMCEYNDGDVVQGVVSKGYFENTRAAMQVLMRFEPQKAPLGKFFEKAALYREWKEKFVADGMDAKEATELAIEKANEQESL